MRLQIVIIILTESLPNYSISLVAHKTIEEIFVTNICSRVLLYLKRSLKTEQKTRLNSRVYQLNYKTMELAKR